MKNLIAKARTGQYQGFEDENGVITFLGIRYAKPPKRWERAQELPASDELFSAKDYGSACWQPYLFGEFEATPPMSEDCLTLNVWTDDIDVKKKPVMVWIHGGSYTWGSNRMDDYDGTYCGDSLVNTNRDIVYVNINYRINAFGSLDLRRFDPVRYKDSANLQAWDQTTALKWIKQNIEAFGGDPDNITIMGQSAGGHSVATLTCSPIANRYFNHVIPESSAIDYSLKTDADSQKMTDRFIEITGADTLEKLLALEPVEIIKAALKMMEVGIEPAFSPMGDDELIPSKPYQALRNGVASHIDVMTGTTSGEFDTMMTPFSPEEKREMCQYSFFGTINDETIDAFVNNYPDRDIDTAYMDLMNDDMRAGQVAFADACAAGGSNVFMYYISLMTEGSTIRPQHCFEIPYWCGKIDANVFMGPDFERVQGVTPTKETERRIQGCWTNFARFGNPNGEHIPTQWNPFTEEKHETMIIDHDWEMVEGVREKDLDLIMDIFTQGGNF